MLVRLSELSGKEIIDVDNGERLGLVGQTDLVICETTGSIHSLLLPTASFLGLGKKRAEVVIPWQAVRKIGPEMMIVELRQRGRVYE
ncbi:YlmC/YmxH family sporulation protein [Caldalkalibacillus uzonensis]|uniref:YlmC/YmxH family sporulation protein n=1 Tax=Caldalkalibacillus uzonensis TaxID=353224 RepID=A0ABU0CLL6_9BACI|nr:YlmC/YmxH family sporulation protein [Caldalkalibacillus uzonensis]